MFLFLRQAHAQDPLVNEPLQALGQQESLSLSNELFILNAFGKDTAKLVLAALKATKQPLRCSLNLFSLQSESQ